MGPCWSRAIWDVTAVGWLLGEEYMRDRLVHSPIPEYDHHYSFSEERHLIRCVYFINRDALFHKLFTAVTSQIARLQQGPLFCLIVGYRFAKFCI